MNQNGRYGGMHRLSLWLARKREETRLLQMVARILLEVGADLPEKEAPSRVPGDEATLRGIPVVGTPGGFPGAIRGTRPGDGLE